jgi:hypothetical protein
MTVAGSQGSSGFPCPCALLFFGMTIIMLSVLQFFQPDEITAAVRRFLRPCVAQPRT